MGLVADIFRSSPNDYSYGGISSQVRMVTIVNVEGPFEPAPTRPAVELVEGNNAGTVKIVPVEKPTGRLGPMFGGTYVGTSDSRLGDAICKITGQDFAQGIVPLHDRWEPQSSGAHDHH